MPDPQPGAGGLRSSGSAGEAKNTILNHSVAMGKAGGSGTPKKSLCSLEGRGSAQRKM